ncbi:MAG: hypothetical protein OEQ12_07725, partial [Nitrosopumilus sp.]|nr:hypothetical protein [Nitrosopumilus sp.]
LTCDATGFGPFGVVGEETCWTIFVEAPDGYDPADDTLVGNLIDAPEECFEVVPGVWNATTDSTPQGDIDAPVDNPVDTVNIIADANFPGTFTGTWFLDDSNGVEQTGACTPGDVQANGTATLTCDATGFGPFGVVGEETCWTIFVEAPDGYDPANDTLVGTGIAEECFEVIQEDFAGHTPGFYKNNWDKFHFDDGVSSWVEELGSDDFSEAFGLAEEIVLRDKGKDTFDNATLREALDANGGGVNALARHCVAAKLNAEHPDINYPIPDAADVIAQCKAALESGDEDQIDDLKDLLDEWNNFGTDEVDQHWPN